MKTATVDQENNTVTIDGQVFRIGSEVEVDPVQSPSADNKGFFIMGNGAVHPDLNVIADSPSEYNKQGNWFKTEAEANTCVEHRKLTKLFVDAIARLNAKNNWVCDWKDSWQDKIYFKFDNNSNEVTYRTANYIQCMETKFYFCIEIKNELKEQFTDNEIKFIITGTKRT